MRYYLCNTESAVLPVRGGLAGAWRAGMALVVALVLAAWAPRAIAAQKVTLSVRNAKIEQVFSEISKQTDYRFFYSDEVARRAMPVSITVKDVDVLDLLNELMHGQSMQYKVIAGTIIINLAGHTYTNDKQCLIT